MNHSVHCLNDKIFNYHRIYENCHFYFAHSNITLLVLLCGKKSHKSQKQTMKI